MDMGVFVSSARPQPGCNYVVGVQTTHIKEPHQRRRYRGNPASELTFRHRDIKVDSGICIVLSLWNFGNPVTGSRTLLVRLLVSCNYIPESLPLHVELIKAPDIRLWCFQPCCRDFVSAEHSRNTNNNLWRISSNCVATTTNKQPQ